VRDGGDVDAIAATLPFGNGFAERERFQRTRRVGAKEDVDAIAASRRVGAREDEGEITNDK
jgi:hypothetical protein